MKKLVLFIFGFLIFINLSSQELSKTDEIQYDSIDNGLTDSETKLIDSLLTALLSDSAFLQAQANELAGRWEDDNGNWERAFGVEPSPGINIIHSFY